MNLRLDWRSYQATKYACENWHYSKSIPTPPLDDEIKKQIELLRKPYPKRQKDSSEPLGDHRLKRAGQHRP